MPNLIKSNFTGINSKYFDIYINKKYILTYDLSFKKYRVGLDSSKLGFGKKITHFNFMRTKTYKKNLQWWILNFLIFIKTKNIF